MHKLIVASRRKIDANGVAKRKKDAHQAAVLAETIGTSPEELADLTTGNFFRLFTKMPRPDA